MARDRTKNAYFTVGIPIDSETYQALKADAKETGISIPQLCAVRITDWYRLSAGGAHITATQAARPSGNTLEQAQNPSATNDLQSRASAAAAAWGGEDDE
jgi:hypothetical protein